MCLAFLFFLVLLPRFLLETGLIVTEDMCSAEEGHQRGPCNPTVMVTKKIYRDIPGIHGDPASDGFLNPWKYFSRKSRWAGTWISDEVFISLSSSPSRGGGGAVCESKLGGGYDRDVALRIVIN
jgi:hypothetical protein